MNLQIELFSDNVSPVESLFLACHVQTTCRAHLTVEDQEHREFK